MTDLREALLTRERLTNVGLMILSAAVTLAAVEAFLLFGMGIDPGAYPQVTQCQPTHRTGDVEQYQFDGTFGWHGAPGGQYVRRETVFEDEDRYTHDERGFRDTFDSGNETVLVLGDSFAYGWLADDHSTFPYLLDRRSPETSFVNLGQGGYGTAQELLVYRNQSGRFDHDLVILAYVANDPRDNRGIGPHGEVMPRRPRFELIDGDLRQTHDPTPNPDRRSRDAGLVPDGLESAIADRSASFTYFSPVISRLLLDENREEVNDSEFTARLDLTAALLQEVAAEAERNDADVLVVTIPPKPVAIADGGGDDSDLDAYRVRWRDQRGMVRSVASSRASVNHLDLTPTMQRRIADGSELYGRRDGHPNEAGYEVIAETILTRLRSTGHVAADRPADGWESREQVSRCPDR